MEATTYYLMKPGDFVRGTLCETLTDPLGEIELLFGDTIQGFTQSSNSVQVQFTKNGVREFDCVIGAEDSILM